MQFPITIGLHRSRFLGRLLLLSAIALTALICGYPRSTGILPLILIAAWGLAIAAFYRLTPPFSALRLASDGQITVVGSNRSDEELVRLLPNASVHPWLVAFRLICQDGRKHAVVVTADMISADDFRRLRVFLRWRAGFSESDADAD